MKTNFLLVAIILLTVQQTTGQNYQTVDEVNDACETTSSSNNDEAEIAVDNILNQIGLFRNFKIIECPDINNAEAKIITSASGVRERYIIYDSQFFKNIDIKAGNSWAAISILAHEIGHHLNGHALLGLGSTPKIELEADEFSGFVLAKMGATLEEAQSAIQTLRNAKATSTHPAKVDRLAIIKKGWSRGKGLSVEITIEEDNKTKALKLYRKGEQEYTNKNFNEALHTFKSAKDLGNIDAYFYISSIYYYGMGVNIDYIKAYDYAKKGYELGSIPATYLYATYIDDGFVIKQNKEDAERLFQKDFQFKWFKNQYEKYKTPFIAANIGIMYVNGYGGIDQNDELALDWFKNAEREGDNLARFKLAVMYSNGIVIEKDYDEAIYLFRKAAEEGYASALNSLGVMYDDGHGVQKNSEKAIFWIRKAAKKGNARSILNIGINYQFGKTTDIDYKEAFYWYKKIAHLPGYYTAHFNLANMYENGLGVEQDYKEAIFWYLKAAIGGNISAQNNLGLLYKHGLGVEQDYKKAMHWFQKSAKQDGYSAYYNIGVLYLVGLGVKQNNKEAINWFITSAENGFTKSQITLGKLYYKGENIEKDFEKAFYWFQKAAEIDDATGQFNLAVIYQSVEGYKNDSLALEWFLKSAEQNFMLAQKSLAYMYRDGKGVEQDYQKAFIWFSKAAEQSDLKSMYNLGIIYQNGYGVNKNGKEAFFWFQKAAKQGNDDSQVSLGYLYYKGIGVEEDYEKAIYWLQLSARQDNKKAQEALTGFGESW